MHEAFPALLVRCLLGPGKTSLLYGLLNQGEAYLIPTWLMREQRLAQVQINQSIRSVYQHALTRDTQLPSAGRALTGRMLWVLIVMPPF